MASGRGEAAMNFSYNEVWEETVRTLRSNSSLLFAVAGVFLFLPTLIVGYVAPPPPDAQSVTAMINHFQESLWLRLAALIVSFIGNLAILTLVLDDNRPTVGRSIQAALGMLPAYFLLSLLSGFMIIAGLFFFLLPGLYLIGRLAASGPALVAEGRRNPLEIIRRSFDLSKGKGWAVIGLLIILFIAFYVLMLAVTLVFGSLLLLLDRATGLTVGTFLLLCLGAAISAAFNTVFMVLIASIYRRLRRIQEPAGAPSSGI
jgi:hypothetical protein